MDGATQGRVIDWKPGWTICTDGPMNLLIGEIGRGQVDVLAVPRGGKLKIIRCPLERTINLTIVGAIA